MGCQAALPRRRRPRPKGLFDGFPAPWRVGSTAVRSSDGRNGRWARRGRAARLPVPAVPRVVASTEQDEHIKHEQECDEQQYRCHWLPPEVVQSKRFESVRSSEAMFAIRTRRSARLVRRPLPSSSVKYTLTCSIVNKVLLSEQNAGTALASIALATAKTHRSSVILRTIEGRR